jgi:hypothetical protein
MPLAWRPLQHPLVAFAYRAGDSGWELGYDKTSHVVALSGLPGPHGPSDLCGADGMVSAPT